MVMRHLDRQRFRVWPVFLDRDGGFWPQRKPLLASETWTPGDRSAALGPMRPGTALDWLLECARVEMVFPVLHGPFGEDGRLQGMLELYNVPFVGSGCLASALAMNKQRTRQVLQTAGVRLANAYVPEASLQQCDTEYEWARLQVAVGLPCFCKAECSGSSRGVARVSSRAEFEAFVAAARPTFERWFAESLVTGVEITVPVLGNCGEPLEPLPPVGIYPRFSDHFDERAKYEKGACDEIAPPRGWTTEQCREVQNIAMRCHRELGCDGMSRTDMIMGQDGPVVLEVNTIPGMTETSLLPKSAAAVGMSMAMLLSRLVDHAVARTKGAVAHSFPARSQPTPILRPTDLAAEHG
jgi:D-alanine-D-alanine ligase